MKVAIYCRLSLDDREKTENYSESIINQKSMLTSYAFDQSWEIYDIYCDENYSGIDGTRPEYNRLLEDAKKHRFDIILCKTQSRFSRNMEHIEKYLNGKLQEWNIRFVSVLDNVDTDVKNNKKARQINGLINEWYLEDLSDNVKAVLNNKHKEGKSTRAFLPYGLKKSENDKNKIDIDPYAAAVVRRIFNLYTDGVSTRKIAEILNTDKILSPQEYKISKGEKLNIPKKSSHKKWTQQAVIRILKNRMYIGDLVHNIYHKPSYKSKRVLKNSEDNWTVIPNSHKPIVPHEIFFRANEILKNRGKKDVFIRCGVCNLKMNIVKKKCKSKEYVYIKCASCGLSVKGTFLMPFFNEKYEKTIKEIVVYSKYGAKIIFR